MSIEIFEVIKEKNIFSENFSVTLLDDNKKEIVREYISKKGLPCGNPFFEF